MNDARRNLVFRDVPTTGGSPRADLRILQILFLGILLAAGAWLRDACPATGTCFRQVREREGHEAQTLADLTGWNIDRIMKKVGLPDSRPSQPWWKGLWN